MNKKCQAYTVLEMIVVMIISCIVVSMSYFVFHKVVLLNHRIGGLYNKNYNVILFDQLLSSDCLLAPSILKTANGFSCIYKDKQINYTVGQQICRAQLQLTDTLAGVSDLLVEYKYADLSNTLIRTIKITGTYDGDPIQMIYNKEYGADILMNTDEQGN